MYEDLWPGIDLVYEGTGSRLKYNFIVHPGADPNQIRLAYQGASTVTLNPAGQLDITTPVGGFTDDTPYTYQETKGTRVEVPSAYNLEPGTTTFGIPVGAYDPTRDLIIDPTVLHGLRRLHRGRPDRPRLRHRHRRRRQRLRHRVDPLRRGHLPGPGRA